MFNLLIFYNVAKAKEKRKEGIKKEERKKEINENIFSMSVIQSEIFYYYFFFFCVLFLNINKSNMPRSVFILWIRKSTYVQALVSLF